MKKMLLLFAIPFYLFACKDSDKQPTQTSSDCDTLSTEEVKKMHEINEADALGMASYYRTLHHDTTNIIQAITMNALTLRKLLHNQKSIRLITAAYTAESNDCKRGDITMIIQLWGKNGEKLYYDIRSVQRSFMAKKVICPPPTPCDVTVPPTD